MATKTKPRQTSGTVTVPVVTPEAEAVQALIQKAIRSFNAGDLETYLGLFTDDVESYSGVQTPLRFEGLPAWKSYIEGLRKGMEPRYEQRQPTLRSFNADVVVVNSYYVFSGTGPTGQMETQTGRASLVVVKQGGKWLIANQHYSPMF